ncbi:benzoate 4-monooxygenase cytochrome P450 [Nemania sp. NC0429]|nr:benzoate 4-monooxygenase cytochrome P450 [Nemania sp. NC0429]
MLDTSIPDIGSVRGFLWLCAVVPLLVAGNVFYNVYLHPLRNVPGPFWGRASEIPSWYYTLHGKRHIWLWQLFQIYGARVRVAPNLVLFMHPEAHAAIYGMKSNVRRSTFYIGLTKNIREKTTVNTIDPAEHAKRRKMLNTCFTDNSVNTVSAFISQHIDRWHQIMLDKHDKTTEWSTSVDLGEQVDHLVFDIMGDICFGRSFNIKEPGDNPLREVPHNITHYLKFYYSMCRSPLLGMIIWLKPRGLDQLVELITPRPVQQFQDFVHDSVTKRFELYKKQEGLPENERRRDMFYFLCKAQDSSTGQPAYTEDELRAEASLLIIAGSDTTTATLASIFWYLVRAPRCYQKLVDELQRTFETAEDVVYSPKLMGCTYLRACIDEGMRLVPPGPCEPPREVLVGGLHIMGEYYPKGTIVGTAPWCDSRNEEVYGDPGAFRPERWIVDEAAGVTQEMVSEIRANFHPFLTGPGACAGKNIAIAEILLVVAKTLLRFDLRKTPGSTLGEGRPELGWGERNRKQYQIVDAYVSLKQGPEVQFRTRVSSEAKSG